MIATRRPSSRIRRPQPARPNEPGGRQVGFWVAIGSFRTSATVAGLVAGCVRRTPLPVQTVGLPPQSGPAVQVPEVWLTIAGVSYRCTAASWSGINFSMTFPGAPAGAGILYCPAPDRGFTSAEGLIMGPLRYGVPA